MFFGLFAKSRSTEQLQDGIASRRGIAVVPQVSFMRMAKCFPVSQHSAGGAFINYSISLSVRECYDGFVVSRRRVTMEVHPFNFMEMTNPAFSYQALQT